MSSLFLLQPFSNFLKMSSADDDLLCELCENEESKDVESQSEKNQEDKDEKIIETFLIDKYAIKKLSVDLSVLYIVKEHSGYIAGIELPPEV